MNRAFAETLNSMVRGDDTKAPPFPWKIPIGCLVGGGLGLFFGGDNGLLFLLAAFAACFVLLLVHSYFEQKTAPSHFGRAGQLSRNEWDAARAKLLKGQTRR